MAQNQNVIAISIKAFLPTGKTLDEQFAALSIVKQAHETGDYSSLLAAAQDVEIKTEAKTRRVEIAPTAPAPVPEISRDPLPGWQNNTAPVDPNFADLPAADPAFASDVIPTAPEDFALAAEPAPAPKKSR